MDRWLVPLTIVAPTGNITQLYPEWAAAGGNQFNPATPVGTQIRQPCEGQLVSLQCKTDGANAFDLEIYDVSGIVLGIDVSSAATITNAEMAAAITAGKAKRIFIQNFAGSGLTPIAPVGPAGFTKGLAARASNTPGTGTCVLNLVVHGGYRYIAKG